MNGKRDRAAYGLRHTLRQNPYETHEDTAKQWVVKATNLALAQKRERVHAWENACYYFNLAGSTGKLADACNTLSHIVSQIRFPLLHQTLNGLSIHRIAQWMESSANYHYVNNNFLTSARYYNTIQALTTGDTEKERRKRIVFSNLVIDSYSKVPDLHEDKVAKIAFHNGLIANEHKALNEIDQAIKHFYISGVRYLNINYPVQGRSALLVSADLSRDSHKPSEEIDTLLILADWDVRKDALSAEAAENFSRLSKLFYNQNPLNLQPVLQYSFLAAKAFAHQNKYEEAALEYKISAKITSNPNDRCAFYKESLRNQIAYASYIDDFFYSILSELELLSREEFVDIVHSLGELLTQPEYRALRLHAWLLIAPLYTQLSQPVQAYELYYEAAKLAQHLNQPNVSATAYINAARNIQPYMLNAADNYRDALSKAIVIYRGIHPMPHESIAYCNALMAERFNPNENDKRHFHHAAAIAYRRAGNVQSGLYHSIQVLAIARMLRLSRETIAQYEEELSIVQQQAIELEARRVITNEYSPVFFPTSSSGLGTSTQFTRVDGPREYPENANYFSSL